ncbi:MAG: YlxR family protein [Clostridia bacterium]|nr:YlxR family protein [Clostridia bacterium]
MGQKKQPERMCVGCGQRRPKGELIRVVCHKEQGVWIDKTGKADGRGAYLCPDAACLKKAQKAGRLQKAFSMNISEELYQRLEREIQE